MSDVSAPAGTPSPDGVATMLKVGRVLVWVVYAIAIVDVVLLLTAFFLQLFGASTDASFTQWVYRSTTRAMEPFRGIFPTTTLSDTSVLNTSLLFAAMVYGFIAVGFHALYELLSRRLLRRTQPAPAAIPYQPASAPMNDTGGPPPMR